MIDSYRRDFNRRFQPDLYTKFLRRLDESTGAHVDFRNSETPCFFTGALLDRIAAYGIELTRQLMDSPEYLKRSLDTIPPEFHAPGDPGRPLFLVIDFGLDAAHEPKLVEIQAFPSLYAYHPHLADVYREVYGLDPELKNYLGGLEDGSYREILGRAVLGHHKPADVILTDIHPEQQKTYPDFLLTARDFGIRIACISKLEKRGRKLYFEGRPVERIYNRAIVDELVRKQVRLPFDYRDELDVEWAGHPNWYFRISKFSIPFLNHVSVPKTFFLDQVRDLPENLDRWVLKPLFSFAGLGVIVGPTRAEIDAVQDRANYILQERVDFAPVIETPHGPTKAEIRMMYVWDREIVPMTTIIRMGRGKQMGVDHNKNMEWVGASAGFWI
ncbi:MAG: hypothetical protein K2X35_01790 [Bryobacteraceae bacterium]|nr:hypothetical protein [Bryobacteraceae bacterium]